MYIVQPANGICITCQRYVLTSNGMYNLPTVCIQRDISMYVHCTTCQRYVCTLYKLPTMVLLLAGTVLNCYTTVIHN